MSKLLLTSDCIVTEAPSDDDEPAGHGPPGMDGMDAMGGMGGMGMGGMGGMGGGMPGMGF